MARIHIGMQRTPELARLAPDASWIEDGPDPEARIYVGLWPRAELRAAGIDWDAYPKLELVKLITAGANHAGWRTLPAVALATTPGAMAPAIAEHVLGHLLSWSRGIVQSTRAIARGKFRMGAPVRALSELSVGVVGYGSIGKATSRLLAGLGCTVHAVNRSGTGGGDELATIRPMSALHEMAAECDVLVVAVAHVAATDGLIDEAALEQLRAPGCLINVSRGPVVDEAALYAWLAADARRGAGLDVWWQYPKGEGRPFSQPFEALENVSMTPHNAPNVAGHHVQMLRAALEDVAHYLAHGDVKHQQFADDYAF